MGQNGIDSLTMRQRIAPSFFCRELNKGKRKKKMKVVKTLMKALWWIVKLPVLPLILGWKKSKGKKAGMAFGGGGKEETVEVPGLGRLLHTVFYAIPLYVLYVVIFYAVVIAYGLVMSSIKNASSETESKPTAPIVEQANEQNNSK